MNGGCVTMNQVLGMRVSEGVIKEGNGLVYTKYGNEPTPDLTTRSPLGGNPIRIMQKTGYQFSFTNEANAKLKNIYKTNFTITAWCKLNGFTDLAPIFGSGLSADKGFPGIFFRDWGGYEGVFAPYENNEVLLHRSFSTFDCTAWCFYSVTRDRSTGLDYLGVNGVVTSFKMHEYSSIDDTCNIGYFYTDNYRDMDAWLDDICVFDDVIPEFKYNYSVPTSYMSDFYLNRYSAYEDKEILYSYKK